MVDLVVGTCWEVAGGEHLACGAIFGDALGDSAASASSDEGLSRSTIEGGLGRTTESD